MSSKNPEKIKPKLKYMLDGKFTPKSLKALIFQENHGAFIMEMNIKV